MAQVCPATFRLTLADRALDGVYGYLVVAEGSVAPIDPRNSPVARDQDGMIGQTDRGAGGENRGHRVRDTFWFSYPHSSVPHTFSLFG